MKLREKAVLITGGSRGLGFALGKELAERGARVVLVARGEAELAESVRTLRGAGLEVYGVAADLSDKHAIYPLVGQAAALVGPIDIVIHNASVLGPVPLAHLVDTECEQLEHTLSVNLLAPFRLNRALAGSMLVRGGGVLVHISSDAAVEAYPTWGAYGVSKAALDHLSRSFAVELDGTGVQVFSVDPGEMDTRMHADAVPDAERESLAKPDAVARRIVDHLECGERIPQGARVKAQDLSARKPAHAAEQNQGV